MKTLLLLLLVTGPALAQQPARQPRLESLQLNLPPPATPEAAIAPPGPTLTDSLAYLLRLTTVDFRGLRTAAGPATSEYPEVWQVPRLLGATATYCFSEGDDNGLKLRLNYGPDNRRTRLVAEAAQQWLLQLARANQGSYQLRRLYEDVLLLEHGGRLVVRCELRMRRDKTEPLRLEFHQDPVVLADEARYGGHFPAAPTASTEPQVWEVRGGGTAPGSYLRYNGVVRNGQLLKGTKTFHGYDDFLDGTWHSDCWQPRYTPFPARFRPAGTTDTVWVHLTDRDVSDARVDGRSSHLGTRFAGIRTPVPAWVTTPHPVHAQQVAARWAEYQRQHPQSAAGSYAAPDGYSASRPAAPAYQPTEHVGTCIACHGSGWVDGGDGLGHLQRQQCTQCRGSGQVTSRY